MTITVVLLDVLIFRIKWERCGKKICDSGFPAVKTLEKDVMISKGFYDFICGTSVSKSVNISRS